MRTFNGLTFNRPVSPHQVGQRLVSFTTPEANIRRKSSQRSSQKVTLSWKPDLRPHGIFIGAIRTARKPTSNNRLSLRESGRGGGGWGIDVTVCYVN